MEGNNDEAVTCVQIAKEAIASGNQERALKFIKPSPGTPEKGLNGEQSYTQQHLQLIPKLPDKLALLCLARVPRQYHHTLSQVSKPIRTAVVSQEFFDIRSSLGLAEEVLYLTVRTPFHYTAAWFVLYRQLDGTLIHVPLPPLPGVNILHGSSTAAMGGKIYVFGGWLNKVLMAAVWVLDCTSNTWSRGPDMLSPRCYTFPVVIGHKIYVIGGVSLNAPIFSEVLDLSANAGRWVALPRPPPVVNDGNHSLYASGASEDNGLIRVWMGGEEIRYDPAVGTWGVGPVLNRVNVFPNAVNGVVYGSTMGSRKLLQLNDDNEWKVVEGVENDFPRHVWTRLKLLNFGGTLVALMGRGPGELFGIVELDQMDTNYVELQKNMPFEVWCVEIEGQRVVRSEKIFRQMPPPTLLLKGVREGTCCVCMTDWNIFKVSL